MFEGCLVTPIKKGKKILLSESKRDNKEKKKKKDGEIVNDVI